MRTLCRFCHLHTTDLQTISHIVDDRHVGKQRIALEHHADVALSGAQMCDVLSIDQNLTATDGLQACNHAQGGGLATSRRAEQSGECALGHHKIYAFDHQRRIALTITFGHLAKLNAGHGSF